MPSSLTVVVAFSRRIHEPVLSTPTSSLRQVVDAKLRLKTVLRHACRFNKCPAFAARDMFVETVPAEIKQSKQSEF